ncbi:MAG: hypothetical protein Q8S33_15450 [Myxococcales bacterium]|nr:hypothetical protein [Myxococcales bacterium]MDP3501732.1 hypothetical protein [Myxococcales bacterium]
MAQRTDEERVSAVESMFRIRAVESPPDERGTRTIWHRGLKGAELVTDVDASGRVTRQELSLFDDVVVWSDGGLKTGESAAPPSKRPKPSEGLTWDTAGGAERLDRIGTALKRYRGSDRYIQHVRDVLGVSDDAGVPIDAPITRTARAVREDHAFEEANRRASARAAKRRSQLGLLGIVAGAVLALAGLVMLWRSMGS